MTWSHVTLELHHGVQVAGVSGDQGGGHVPGDSEHVHQCDQSPGVPGVPGLTLLIIALTPPTLLSSAGTRSRHGHMVTTHSGDITSIYSKQSNLKQYN